MEFKEAKNKFVQTWGALGSQWGINKTMAQIHALLMVSNEPISMEDIMEELQISRGNASMNLRALMDWGIVYKEYKAGARRERRVPIILEVQFAEIFDVFQILEHD